MRYWIFLTFLLLSVPAFATDASKEWDSVTQKIEKASDYQFRYSYRGPKGRFFFDYTVDRSGPKVRTKILKGSDRGRGTIILFDPERSTDSVSIKASFITISRSLEAKDVKNSSLYIPLYEQILGKLKRAKLKKVDHELAGDLFEFEEGNKTHRVRVHPESRDIVGYSLTEGVKQVEVLSFTGIKWDQEPELSL